MKERSIRVTARCLFRHEGQILTISAQDPDKPAPHYSVPGGGVEFGETSEQAIRREMQEELGAEITDLELRAVTEVICEVLGRPHHEIVFLYEGRFVGPGFYARSVRSPAHAELCAIVVGAPFLCKCALQLLYTRSER
jgi:ADP-ribose pyrophosphatase YjhB (NUDIX family)